MPRGGDHIRAHVSHHGRYDDSWRGDGDGYRFVELIAGVRRRRDWSDDEKLAIIAESFSATTSISAVARRHGVNKNQLFQWRRQFREGAFNVEEEPIGFVPVVCGLADEAGVDEQVASASPASGVGCREMIEIVIGTVTIRVPPSSDDAALRRVLAAVRALG